MVGPAGTSVGYSGAATTEGDLKSADTKVGGGERRGRGMPDCARGERGEGVLNAAEGETRESSQPRSQRETALLEGSPCCWLCEA